MIGLGVVEGRIKEEVESVCLNGGGEERRLFWSFRCISDIEFLLREEVIAVLIGEELEGELFFSFCCEVFCDGMGE